jgi:hypothetical protein
MGHNDPLHTMEEVERMEVIDILPSPAPYGGTGDSGDSG